LRFGHNFVKTIQRLSAERTELKVVFDQVGTPTNASDLADFIVQAVENLWYKGKREVYHFSNEGVCSWYDFAVTIVAQSGNNCKVSPCRSDEFPSKVTRPAYSVLDKTKLKKDFNYSIPHWRHSFNC
jgi:dTDP-4-dehydrorhamnose reductase